MYEEIHLMENVTLTTDTNEREYFKYHHYLLMFPLRWVVLIITTINILILTITKYYNISSEIPSKM
jgi:hypothetical protein